jgi:predicted transcriptional regulator
MGRKRRRISPGGLEARVMKVLWRRGRGTVREVKEALRGGSRLAYTTVLTTLQNLEKKGFVRHERVGRGYVYHPRVDEEEVTKAAVKDLVKNLFDGSGARLVNTLLADEDLDPEELEELEARIRELKGRGGEDG